MFMGNKIADKVINKTFKLMKSGAGGSGNSVDLEVNCELNVFTKEGKV